MRWIALVALLTFGCDSEQGAAQAQVGADARAGDAEGLLPVPGSGGEVSGGAGGGPGAAGAPDAGGAGPADARELEPQVGGAGGGPTPVVNRCTVIPSTFRCGYLNARFETVDPVLYGLSCHACTLMDGGKVVPLSGCSPQAGQICADCASCCYTQVDAPCFTAAECCAPLRCQDSGATGKAKVCR